MTETVVRGAAATSVVRAWAVVAGWFVADQVTKFWAQRTLDTRTIDVLPTLEFDLTYNSGFSFGTAEGAGRLIGVLVVVIAVGVAVLMTRETDNVRRLLYATVLGGALGNLADRIFRADDGLLSGAVVDFIDVSWWAVFNVADIAVVCGAIALIAHELWRNRRPSDDHVGATDAGPGQVDSR